MLDDGGLKLARILLLLGGWAAAPVEGGTLAVESTEPPRNAGNVAPTSAITIHFDRAVSAASVSAASLRAYGRQSGPVSGAFTFLPGGLGIRLRPGRPFVPGETVLVNLSHDLSAVDGSPLRAAGYAFQFSVAATGAGRLFTDLDLALFDELADTIRLLENSAVRGLVFLDRFEQGDLTAWTQSSP